MVNDIEIVAGTNRKGQGWGVTLGFSTNYANTEKVLKEGWSDHFSLAMAGRVREPARVQNERAYTWCRYQVYACLVSGADLVAEDEGP